MKPSLALTGQGIAQALARLAEPAIDTALRERAGQVARDIGATRVPATPHDVMPAKAGTQ